MIRILERIIGLALLVLGFYLCVAHPSSPFYFLIMGVGVFLMIIGWYVWGLGYGPGSASKFEKIVKRIVKKLMGIALIALSAYLIVKGGIDDNMLLVVVGTIFLIFGITILQLSSEATHMSGITGSMKIRKLETSVEDLHKAFAYVDTPLGQAWITKTRGMSDRNSIVWGPNSDGIFIYGYYYDGLFNLSYYGDNGIFLDSEALKENTRNPKQKSFVCESSEYKDIARASSLLIFAQMLENYEKNHIAAWPADEEKIYVFDETFECTDTYHLIDMKGNVVYGVNGGMSSDKFVIGDERTGEEYFRLEEGEKIYGFYRKGKQFAAIKGDFKENDNVKVKMEDGEIILKRDFSTEATSCLVIMNDKVIGAIGKNLGVIVNHEPRYEYAVISYSDEYLDVVAGMSILVAMME